jgi:phosphate transport system substrate-binding protein
MKKLWIGLASFCALAWFGLGRADLQANLKNDLSGKVKIDGSSTVFPITEAAAEQFGKVHPRVRVTVGMSGTGGGFKKFALGEIDINNASRLIKDSEVDAAKKNGVGFVAVPVAHDGITVVVNKANTWVDKLTVAELKKIWEPGSKVVTWQDVRAGWPNRKIKLYGPGTDSGTFDFFTEAINGKAQLSRSEFTKSEDDNVLVQGVEGDKDSLGYFGYAYYTANQTRLKAVSVDAGKGPIAPNDATINDESYAPLSRVVYIYVSTAAAKRPEVQSFVRFYLDSVSGFVKEVGYVALPASKYKTARVEFDKAVAKSIQ